MSESDETVFSPRRPSSDTTDGADDATVVAPRNKQPAPSAQTTPSPEIESDATVIAPRAAREAREAPGLNADPDATTISRKSLTPQSVAGSDNAGSDNADRGDATIVAPRNARVESDLASDATVVASPRPSVVAPQADQTHAAPVPDGPQPADENRVYGPRGIPESVASPSSFTTPAVTKRTKSADELWELNAKRNRRRAARVVVGLTVSVIAVIVLVIVVVVTLVR